MDLKLLQEKLKAFAVARNWEQFHTPKNLSMALMVEAAELMELFQWKTPEESSSAKFDASLKVRIGEELADVLLYLIQLADHTGVDLEHAVDDKLQKNAKKHPVPGEYPASVQPEQKPAQTHVLVDWENVQPKEEDIRRLVSDVTNVWIFHGPNQKRVGENHKSFGDALTLVPISRTGNNALDFHLSYYVGYISSRSPTARFVVISNDKGYGPMLAHAEELGFAASQVGFNPPRTAVKKAVAKKVPVRKVPAKKSAGAKGSVTPAQKAKPPKTAKAPAAKKSVKLVPPKVASKLPAVKTLVTPAPSKKVATTKTKAKKTSPPSPPVTVAALAPKAGMNPYIDDEAKAYAHVLASLRNSKNKPARRARLYGAVKSLLGADKPDDATVVRVVERLVSEGHLVIDANGAVSKTP